MATTAVSGSNSTASALAALQSSSSSTKSSSSGDVQANFLNLLVTQLKNQDPLNPMDNAQMTTQLAQINTVSGIEKLNTTVEKLLSSYTGTQNMQAAAMIGKTVLTAGSTLELSADGAIGGVDLAGAADSVTISIKNASGQLVHTQELGAQSAGTLNFTWDGRDSGDALASGKYSFAVTATQGGKTVKATALETGTVSAVTLATDGLTLQLSNQKTAAYSDVKQIMN